jgi:hypothetical protein
MGRNNRSVGKLDVRNHVKLSSCNHRLKEGGIGEATGDRHASMEENVLVTAITAEEKMVDWRKHTDGERLCKQLKYLEERDALHPKHADWEKELRAAISEEHTPEEDMYRWEKNIFDDDDTDLDCDYGTFTRAAAWNFNRVKSPKYCAASDEPRSVPKQGNSLILEPTPIDPIVLDGTSYARSSPTFFKAKLGDSERPCTIGLLDNCASLSLLDRKILTTMPEARIKEKTIRIQGVGTDTSKEFCVLPIYIDCIRSCGGIKEKAKIKIWVEFHIIDDLNESFVIGMDVIAPYQIDIITSKREARIRAPGAQNVPFPIYFGKGMPRRLVQDAYNIVSAQTTTIPPRCEMAVKVLIASPVGTVSHDVFVDPIPLGNTAQGILGVVGKGVYTSETTHVWFANLGKHPLTLKRGIKIATATYLSSTDTVSATKIRHKIGGKAPATMYSCTPKKCGDKKARAVVESRIQDQNDWPTAVLNHAAGLMDPNDRDTPGGEAADGHFDISTDFGENGKPPECMAKVLSESLDAFTLDGRPGLLTDGTQLTLDTDDDKLTPEKLRQMSPRKKQITDDTIDQLLEWDIIESSNSRLSYQVVIVKQNGKDRYCVDYRDLNRHTKPLIYPMQRSDEMFDALAGKKVFSSLDAARGYHQVPIKEEHRWKTAFLTHRGLFQYKTMPFGLKTAPALFQQFMDKVLGGLRWTAALCYIDDVIVFSDSIEEHAEHVRKILQSAIAVGLKFTPAKCHFGYASLTLLGRRVSTEGLEVLQDKLAAVRELKPPTTIKELWHVLGLFGYYRAFIHRYSIIAAPLTALTKGYSTKDNPPGAASKTTIQWSERCQTAFDTLKEKLTNPPILAYPDFMRPFTLYVDASHDGMACALHQEAAVVPETSSYVATVPSTERLIAAQRADPAWKHIFAKPEHFAPNFSIKDGILYRRERICLPNSKDFQRDVFHDVHDSNGHMGFAKSFEKLARQWHRAGMAAGLKSYIQSCTVCAGAKKSRRRHQGEMTTQRHMTSTPFDAIAIDVFELPRCQGHDACLAISDIFTKSVILRPTRKTADAEEIAEILFNSVICKGFLPSVIISDNDSKYTSRVWARIMEKLDTRISLASPYHQQADPAERSIQTAQTVLRCYGDTDWVSRLQYVELVLNEAKHESTGFSPNELLYTANRSPIESLRKPVDDETPELLAFAKARIDEAREQIAIAQERQKSQYDIRHRPHDPIAVGDKAFLLLDQRPVPSLRRNKMDWPKWGPFEVLEISPDGNRVKLNFPRTHKIDWVSTQHVERLSEDEFDRPQPEVEDHKEGEELWEVERVIGERQYGRRKHQQFLIKWRGWPTNQSTWEFEDNLREDMDNEALDEMIEEYRRTSEATVRVASATLEEAGSTAKAIERARTTKKERPILYLSRVLRAYEKNYTILELELGAVVWSVLKLQRYLDGTPFTVVTDHQPILQVVESSSKTITSPRVERWRMLLQPYIGQMTFVHKAGKLHSNVDALSRLPRSGDNEGRTNEARNAGLTEGRREEVSGERQGDGEKGWTCMDGASGIGKEKGRAAEKA